MEKAEFSEPLSCGAQKELEPWAAQQELGPRKEDICSANQELERQVLLETFVKGRQVGSLSLSPTYPSPPDPSLSPGNLEM